MSLCIIYEVIFNWEIMDYSKTNFKLIPLIPNTKRPRDKGWQEDTYVGTDFTNQLGWYLCV
jgi:hypothetical protein